MIYKCIKSYDKDFTVNKTYQRHQGRGKEDFFIDDEGDERYLFTGLDDPSHHFNYFFTKITFINYLSEIENYADTINS